MFGDILKDLRIKKNITQEELANVLNVNKACISAWETNRAQPNYEKLIGLANYFNVTPNYLLGFNKNDLEKIDELKLTLKSAGLMVGDDLTIDELNKALKIVDILNGNSEKNNRGEIMNKRRLEKKLTLRDLEKLVGLSRESLSNYELGKVKISDEVWYKICDVLEIDEK